MAKKEQTLGITAKKDENFGDWYAQVIQKSDLADYTSVSGCIAFKPYSYAIWEKLQDFLNKKFKRCGVENVYFPMLIPEHLLKKEADHVEGFTPEVAWVTHTGNTELSEKLAIRPTSETIMYESYSKWIRSHNDLPLRFNQWCSVVRWEFKHPIPFMRNREFLWQEGHSVFATKKEAEKEVLEILDYYAKAYEELLAIPGVKGKKTEKEKFAGAVYSTTFESFAPTNKSIQSCTSHFLGQNFSKVFGIKFVDKDKEEKFGWQTSWGFSTRSLAAMIIVHSDDKGLVLPPRVAPVQVVIIPILFDDSKDKVLKKASSVKKSLSSLSVEIDSRESYTPGWKFNHWELKGVPIRIEIGPKDLDKGHVVIIRRDNGKKEFVKFGSVKSRVKKLLDEIQNDMFNRAKEFMDKNLVKVKSKKEFDSAVKKNKWVLAPHCGKEDCEDVIKDRTSGYKTNCIPFDMQEDISKLKCFECGKKAKYLVLFGKSY